MSPRCWRATPRVSRRRHTGSALDVTWQGAADLRLSESVNAPAQARQFARTTLFEWGCRLAIPIVEVVLTELVTNALLHALPPIDVRLCLNHPLLTVTVTDAQTTLVPLRRPTVPGSTGGFGLNLIDTIAKDWGYIVDGDHKTVCADLDLTTLEDF